MTDRNHSPESTPSCGCKVGRTAAQYGLSELDTTLVAYWTGEADERYSTRDLATYVNQRVLEAALEAADVPFKDGEVENTYRLLADDDVSSGTRVQTRNELERDGVPIGRVESDFVSHQTVYNHLTDCLETALEEPSDEERLERSAETLGALQSRTAAVTRDTIEKLEHRDLVRVGEFNVVVSVTVTCEDCLQEYTARDLLDQGACRCHEPSTGQH